MYVFFQDNMEFIKTALLLVAIVYASNAHVLVDEACREEINEFFDGSLTFFQFQKSVAMLSKNTDFHIDYFDEFDKNGNGLLEVEEAMYAPELKKLFCPNQEKNHFGRGRRHEF